MQNLLESEEVLQSTSCSRALFLKSYLLAFLLGLVSFYLLRLGPTILGDYWVASYPYLLAGPAILIILLNEIRTRSEKLYVTDRRVIFEQGTFSKSYESLPYSRISDTVIRRRLSQRPFGIADLVINTSDLRRYELRAEGLPDAEEIQNGIEERIEATSGNTVKDNKSEISAEANQGIKTGYSYQQDQKTHDETYNAGGSQTNAVQFTSDGVKSKEREEQELTETGAGEANGLSAEERQRQVKNLEVELYRIKSRLRELKQQFKGYNLEESKYRMMKDSLEERRQEIETKLNQLRA